MKIFSTSQIRQLDSYTIEHEPISSLGLMERAAERILWQFRKDWGDGYKVALFCGEGNNGGDGLALGRMLLQVGYEVRVILVHTGKLSINCEQNRKRLYQLFPTSLVELQNKFTPIDLPTETIVIDALFGSGLSRPLEGIFAETVRWINSLENTVLSIDIPSGLEGERCVTSDDNIIRANVTYTLQFPKTAFFYPENEVFIGHWEVIDIQLHPQAIEQENTHWFYVNRKDVFPKLKNRSKFSHKGSLGHVCLFAGSSGMGGAAVLAALAALRCGSGLVTVVGMETNRQILQIAVPEAMYKTDISNIDKYGVFACGPGIGTSKEAQDMLQQVVSYIYSYEKSYLKKKIGCVFDADALNIISSNSDLMKMIPKNSILTPHPKEFDRLFGVSGNSLQRLQKARQKSMELNVIIILKGAYTSICIPDGNVYFNSTGNPGMATGGMGDVLTGIIAGLLAQGYSPKDSAVTGVYLHGLSADLALNTQSEESLLPRDVIENLGKSYNITRKG